MKDLYMENKFSQDSSNPMNWASSENGQENGRVSWAGGESVVRPYEPLPTPATVKQVSSKPTENAVIPSQVGQSIDQTLKKPKGAQYTSRHAQAAIEQYVSENVVHAHPLLEKAALEAERHRASDIFINSHFVPALKIEGVVTPISKRTLTREEAATIIYSTMTTPQRNKFSIELELDYSWQSESGARFRINAYHEQGRIGMVLRRLTTDIPNIDQLLLPQILKEMAMKPRGLVILAGATGTGKSTSMAAMLDWRNENHAGHIVTIEDPIEFVHKPKKSIITHREIGLDTLSWSTAVKSAMRQAPDVVCIGEVRSTINLEYAMQLAQTGHLCFFTVHANNANQAIERLLSLYPDDRQQQLLMDLALNLVCVIGQRLVIKKDGTGRRAIVDLLINTSTMQDHIFKGEFLEMKALMARADLDGMQTFDQDLFNLYIHGIIDRDEALRHADSVNDLRLKIQLHEKGLIADKLFEQADSLNLI